MRVDEQPGGGDAQDCGGAGRALVVDVCFPFTLATPAYGPSRPFKGDHGAKAAYVDALEAELASLDEELRSRPVSAVRLSGGASIMSADKVCHLVRSIRKTLRLAPRAEVSIDVEPITVCTPSLTDWTSCGVSRVNLAALSTDDRELSALGTAHDRGRLQDALLFLGKFHVSNVSFDLMYGLPGQTAATWRQTLLTAADLGYPHIRVTPLVDVRHTGAASGAEAQDTKSAPAPGTPALPGKEDRRALYELASATLASHGYTEYAPGLFARDTAPRGRDAFEELVRSGADVLGLGAGAQSRLDGFAYRNVCDFDCYVQHSGEFEQIVRDPVRIDPAAPGARPTAFADLTPEERFAALETRGASYGR